MRQTVLDMVLALLCLLPASVWASPTIGLETASADLGKILEGQQKKVAFTVQNIGDEVLEIRKVKASCGCTSSTVSQEKIEAGQYATVETVVNTLGYKGRVNKSVTLSTNDPARPEVVFSITGEIEPVATLDPVRLSVETITVGSVVEKTVVVTPLKPEGFHITKIESTDKRVSVPDYEKARDEKGVYTLKVRIEAGDSPGRIFQRLKIFTDLPEEPVIGLLVYGNIVEEAKIDAPAQ